MIKFNNENIQYDFTKSIFFILLTFTFNLVPKKRNLPGKEIIYTQDSLYTLVRRDKISAITAKKNIRERLDLTKVTFFRSV